MALTLNAVLSLAIVTRCEPVPVTPLPINGVTPLICDTFTDWLAGSAGSVVMVPIFQVPLWVQATVPVIVVDVSETTHGDVLCVTPTVPETEIVPEIGCVTAEPSTFNAPLTLVCNATIWPVVSVGGEDKYSPPIAVPIAGKAEPKLDDVPPPPLPAITFTRNAPLVSKLNGLVCAVT